MWYFSYRNLSLGRWLCLCSCLIPHVYLPLHYVHKQATELYKEASYFGFLIKRGFVRISALCFICEKSLWRRATDNGWLDWRTYYFGSHVRKNAGTWPSQNQCCLVLVDCELFCNKPCNVMPTCCRDWKVHQGPPWDLYGCIPGAKTECVSFCSQCMKHQKQKSYWLKFLVPLFLCGKSFSMHH